MNEKANSSDGKSKIGGGVFNCRYDKYFTLIDADDHLFEFLGYTREEFSSTLTCTLLAYVSLLF